jgi:hypothetical protein
MRKERQVLIASILQEIVSNGGRFLERKGKHWVTLTKVQAHRKVGHALRDAALRESIRISKNEKADGSMEEAARHDRSNKRHKVEQLDEFDTEASSINPGWDEYAEVFPFQPFLQKDASTVFQESKVRRQSLPDWVQQLDSFVHEMTTIDFDCGGLVSEKADKIDQK